MGIVVYENLHPILSAPDVPSATLLGFEDSCHALFVTANKIGHTISRAKSQMEWPILAEILNLKNEIDGVERMSTPHLKSLSKCQHKGDYVENYIFRLFSDILVVCLCRPAAFGDGDGDERSAELAAIYSGRCRCILQTFLKLLRIDPILSRSWGLVQMVFSCSLTLAVTTDSQNNILDKILVAEVIESLSETATCADIAVFRQSARTLREHLATSGVSTDDSLGGNLTERPERLSGE